MIVTRVSTLVGMHVPSYDDDFKPSLDLSFIEF